MKFICPDVTKRTISGAYYLCSSRSSLSFSSHYTC